MECGNYRPISILNIDYKLFTSILTKRLESILPELIHKDQTGFIKQRQTQDNIRRSLHIMRQATQQNLETLIISLDAEKAFDSMRWTFLYKVLAKFGFHATIIDTFAALYDRPTARIKINGDLTNSFVLEKGTRQGCCASPLLFALFIEPLAQWIRERSDIKGVPMVSGEQKLALFADDLLVALTYPTQTLPKFMEMLNEYGLLSGYRININKTQILAINYNPPNDMKTLYRWNWEAESIKYLGVVLPKDHSKIFDLNYGPLISWVKLDIQRWNVIPFLSLSSRIESIKMNILPRLLYLFQSLPVEVPPKQFSEWDKLISRFIWQGKRPRVRYKTLQLRKEMGGMGLPCLRDYYNVAQLRPLVCICSPTYSAGWKDIEGTTVQGIPITALLTDDKLRGTLRVPDDPMFNTLVKSWQDTTKTCKISNQIKPLRCCAYDSDFEPNKGDSRFESWARKGLTTY